MAESDGGSAAARVGSAIGRYGTLLFPADDAILGPALRHYGEWAQREVDLLLELLPQGATVVDVGAFVGTHTLAFARHAGGACRVHAFEPNPWSFELLARNLDLNDVRNVSAYRVALSDAAGALGFAHAAESGGNFGHAELVDPREAEGLIVEATTLDAIGLRQCDLMKIDVEGMEADVLRGGRITLDRCRPIVYCECNALEQGWPVFGLMRQHGYACWGHCFAAFNPDNFRGNAENLFGPARELGLLFVPHERCAGLDAQLDDRQRLARVERLDDLALCLLRKPQYKTEVLAKTVAAESLGTEFLGDETAIEEVARLRANLARLQPALEEAQGLAWGRAAELERIHRQLADTQAAHEYAQQLAYARAAEIDEAAQALARRDEALRQALAALRAERNGAGREPHESTTQTPDVHD